MARPLTVELSADERRELTRMRDHEPEPYLREKAAAILKVADGLSGRETALHRLLKHRRPDTVYGWVHRYRAEGVAGLRVKSGRGRKPAFSPSGR